MRWATVLWALPKGGGPARARGAPADPRGPALPRRPPRVVRPQDVDMCDCSGGSLNITLFNCFCCGCVVPCKCSCSGGGEGGGGE